MSVWQFRDPGLPLHRSRHPLRLAARPLRRSWARCRRNPNRSKRLRTIRCGRGSGRRTSRGRGRPTSLLPTTRTGNGNWRFLPWPYNTSHDSCDDNDNNQHDDTDDPFLGGIKWYLFLGKRSDGVITPILSLNRSWNAISNFWVNSWGCRRRWSLLSEDIGVITIL